MRKERYFGLGRAAAVALLRDAPLVRVAAVDEEGAPLLRTLNHVVCDDAVCFHGAPVGEKMKALDRPVVVAAEEVVASLPSYFADPERACPATTLYRSVQVHGRLCAVDSLNDKARILTALMLKYQPEGGYLPMDPAHPEFARVYQKELAALSVTRVALERLDGKAKLAQNRSPEERGALCARLWERGLPGDPRAIELVRAASPDTVTPSFLRFEPRGGGQASLHCWLDPADAAAAAALVAPTYWNAGLYTRAQLEGAFASSPATVAARDPEGTLVGCARAVSDDHKLAWIYDVVVAPSWRGLGLGQALLRLLLDHPRVRGVTRVLLRTADAQPFYRQFGFVAESEAPPPPFESTLMLRLQR